jgi:hypothetical protein
MCFLVNGFIDEWLGYLHFKSNDLDFKWMWHGPTRKTTLLLHVDACTQIGAFKQVHMVFFEDVKLFIVYMFFFNEFKVEFGQKTS